MSSLIMIHASGPYKAVVDLPQEHQISYINILQRFSSDKSVSLKPTRYHSRSSSFDSCTVRCISHLMIYRMTKQPT